jgi:hypothetical protein
MKDEKIFEDEMMSEEELENVAGGTLGETANDSRFLNVLLHGTTKYHQCDRYGSTAVWFSAGPKKDVKKSWKSLGIDFEPDNLFGNYYFKDGKEISQAEAWTHAERLVGKHLTEAQWNW